MSAGDRAYRASTRTAKRAAKAGRDGDRFLPLPLVVVESAGWRHASLTARALLIEIFASCFGRNGKGSASRKFLAPRGWTSDSTIRKAVSDLIECGLIHETRKGRRPNVAACYAVTWLQLDDTRDLDPELVATFRRGAYVAPEKAPPTTQSARTAAATAARQLQADTSRMLKKVAARCGRYTPAPSDGAIEAPVAPLHGAIVRTAAPLDGPIGHPEDVSQFRRTERI